MSAQQTLSAYPIGRDWCSEHPAAAAAIRQWCAADNERGLDGRIATYMERLLREPSRYGLVAGNGRIYGSNRNDWPHISRYVEEAFGYSFTKRKASCDRQATHATPGTVS